MSANVFFTLEKIPSRYGTGYKAKMKRRSTRSAEECLRLYSNSRSMPHKLMLVHCEAVLDAIIKIAAETGCICRLGDYFSIDPHVRGHFTSQDERFNPTHGHSISFTLKPGKKLKNLVARFKPVNAGCSRVQRTHANGRAHL